MSTWVCSRYPQKAVASTENRSPALSLSVSSGGAMVLIRPRAGSFFQGSSASVIAPAAARAAYWAGSVKPQIKAARQGSHIRATQPNTSPSQSFTAAR